MAAFGEPTLETALATAQLPTPTPAAAAAARVEPGGETPRHGLVRRALRHWKERTRRRGCEVFAGLVQEQLRELSSAGEYRYDRDALELIETCSGTRWSLRDPYDGYTRAADAERAQLIGRAVQAVLVPPIPASFAEARARLVPELESRAVHEIARQASADSWPVAVPIAEGLVASLHCEGHRRRHPCTRAALRQWAVEPEQALAAARLNLGRRASARLIAGPPGVFRSLPDDAAGATLLCLDSLIREQPVIGLPVAMVPTRGTLLVSGSQDAQGIASMLDFAQQALRAARPLCALPLVLSHRGWLPFQPANAALEQRLRRLAIPLEVREYAAQKSVLEVLLRRSRGGAPAPHVAPLFRAQDGAGQPCTWCTWTEGTDALLPRTDFIVFARAGEESAPVRWERVEAELGELLEPHGMYPARVRVRSFPRADRLHALLERARPDGPAPAAS